MSNLDMSKLHDFWWNAMIEHDSSCSNALDSWHYRRLSWPFKRGFSFSFATMMQGNQSAHRFRINIVFFFRCRVWCQRRLKWYFIERYCELWFGKMSQSFKETTVSNFQLRDYRSINRWVYVRTVSQWNNTPETYGLLLYLLFMSPVMIVHSTVFSIVSNSSDSCTKLKRIVTFNLFSVLLFRLFVFHDCPL